MWFDIISFLDDLYHKSGDRLPLRWACDRYDNALIEASEPSSILVLATTKLHLNAPTTQDTAMATKKDKDDFFDNLMKQKLISLPAQYAPVYNMASYPPMQSGSTSHVHTFNTYGMPIHTHGGNPPSTYGEWVGEIHVLTIINYAEDYGQDGYQEELDWELGHSLECPRVIDYEEKITDYMRSPKIRPINFECEMAMEIKRHGLSRLEMDWTQIEPGEYRVQLEMSKEARYTTSSSSWSSTQKIYDLPCRIRLL